MSRYSQLNGEEEIKYFN